MEEKNPAYNGLQQCSECTQIGIGFVVTHNAFYMSITIHANRYSIRYIKKKIFCNHARMDYS